MVLKSGFCIVELEYIGSFFAKKVEEQTKVEYVRKQIKNIQKKQGGSRTSVLLIISVAGVKVTDKRGQVVLIANSLLQIKYCTYSREDKVFCLLSRESSRYEEVHQYVHVFTTARNEVDELNENIRNALSAAHNANTSVPKKTPKESTTPALLGEKPKLLRSQSSQPAFGTSGLLSHPQSLNVSASFPSSFSLGNSSPSELNSLGDVSEKQPTSPQPPISEEARMLKHTVSAQAKLETKHTKELHLRQKSGSNARALQTKSENHLKVRRQQTLPLNIGKSGARSNLISPASIKQNLQRAVSQTSTPRQMTNFVEFKYSPVSYSPPIISSPVARTQANPKSKLENYAKVIKSPSHRINSHLHSRQHLNNTRHVNNELCANANENLAYLNDDDDDDDNDDDDDDDNDDSDSPPLPESIYARLPLDGSTASASTALPPPIAFSDYDSDNRNQSYTDVFKDYIDIDKSSANNNNSDTMSFYSDNYVKAGTLGCKKQNESTNCLQPTSVHMTRSEPLRQSIYSLGSSGISINSIEGEVMHGRPLPSTPGNDADGLSGASTPLRYQNDSPFVTARSSNDSSINRKNKSLTRSQPVQQLSAVEQQKSAEELLKQVPWFQPKMSREQVLENLSREDLGSFIIRESSTHNTCFALSVKVPKFNNPTGIAHYIIHRTPSQGFRIKGLEKEWTNLSSLVVHHTIMPELLPCTLKIPRPVSSRRPSTASRGSNSSRGSSGSASPSSIGSEARRISTPSQIERLAQGLERSLQASSKREAV